VVDEVTRPYRHEGADRFAIDGPALQLSPGVALSLSMALHELCTNAVKYGALSNEAGQVAISWETTRAPSGATLRLRWQESGGPAVVEPAERGFGTRLLERGIASELGGSVEIKYGASGLTCMIEAPVPATPEESSTTLAAA
jgi:two-component sensor histidine kinase